MSKAGAFIWGVVAGLLCKFIDPFSGDGTNTYLALIVLSVGAVYIGYRYAAKDLLFVYIVGNFSVFVVLGFIAEGSVHVGWAMLASFLVGMLLSAPLLAGIIAIIISQYLGVNKKAGANEE